MGIRDFIRDEVFAPALKKYNVLVVYDPHRRYRDICLSMAGSTTLVVDASDGSIESREAAMKALPLVAQTGPAHRDLLIYVPAAPPVTDEQKQADPFAAYTTFGAMFPESDGHSWLSLCLRAKPDHATEIRRLFDQDPSPSFDLIDNIGGGLKWPTLRTLLRVESARDILLALLAPSSAQTEALQNSDNWVTEARALLEATLGLTLKTRGKTWSSVKEELWRYLLFSEFCFDLPGALPTALTGVPQAPAAARVLVEDLCDSLRGTDKFRPTYVIQAEGIERELNLPALCAGIVDLGIRDTFPFEERSVFARAVQALRQDDLDPIRAILRQRETSVWSDKGEVQEQWGLLKAGLALVEACGDADRQVADHVGGLNPLIDFYVTSLRKVDQLQREFEQAVGDHLASDDALSDMVRQARRTYGSLMGKVQAAFTRLLETTGWPPPGRLASADLFDRHVAPLLRESGRRVAYIIVDALRYELGVALMGQLANSDAVDIVPVCAQLPTVTPVGMASLLPGAASSLTLTRGDDAVIPVLDGKPLVGVSQRMDVLRAKYGDRFAEHVLKNFVKERPAVPDAVSLLVLRDTEIDTHLETSPDTTLSLLKQMLNRIRATVRLVKDAGFNDVVIATDHGFFLNAQAEAGDVCAKPPGTWISLHDRVLLGEGAADGANFALPAERVGIRGDFRVFAGPRSLAPYRRGLLYFHGGASLQEAIVPMLTLRLKKDGPLDAATATVTLAYRKGAKKITTRLPVIELAVESVDMFAQSETFEIQLEAHDKKGNVVGEAKPGGAVNAATGTIILRAGQKEQVTLRMTMEFEGKFTIKAFNPMTLATYTSLELETDYVN